jgi:amino acid adenylation domain-containing protein
MKNVEDIYPLSPMQQGLLFHSLYSPQSGFYVQQLSCAFAAGLDPDAFLEAWRRVIDRHPALRTSFAWEGLEEPLQVVRQEVALPVEHYDWRGLSEGTQRERFEALLEDDRRRGFDLAEAPALRLHLVRTGEDAYRFLWSSHHILLDGWSLFSVLQELFAAYDALVRRDDVRLGGRRPFRDYIAWLQGQDAGAAAAFWRERLAGFSTPTPLGIDRPAGVEQASAAAATTAAEEESYGRQYVAFTPALTQDLQALARRHRLTLNTLIQGAWALLLSLYSRERDVLFGMTVSGRPAELAGVEGMVGLFINTLPVRVAVPPDESVASWLRGLQARQTLQQQFDHTALVDIQGWSEVERGQPLFESILGFENYPVDEALKARAAGLHVEEVRFAEKTNFALNIAAMPGPPLALDILYSERRFEAATITRLGQHFQTLLERFVADPGQKLSALSVLTEGEREEMLVGWNRTRAEYPTGQCLHELFEAQARVRPEAPALSHAGREVSYGELNGRANRLARHLRALGVGAETLVALLMERSVEAMVSLMGVLKAGGAYLPLDPQTPRERLAFTLDDARPVVVLTQAHLVEKLADCGGGAAQVVLVDDDWAHIGQLPEDNLPTLINPDNLAYVIYTSGSTGRPKGVCVPHRSVVNHNYATAALYALTPHDRVLQFASLSFDVAVEETFPTWLAGGCVVLRPADLLDAHAAFFHLVERERVTVVNLTTPYWNELMAELSRTRSRLGESLRVAAIGGEKGLPEGFAAAKRAVGARVRLLNVYGPTETTVTNTAYEYDDEHKRRDYASVPIGRPLGNTEIYVLNEHLQPVPVGVGGEVFIGGHSLARGYLRRAGQTAERFVPHPFSPEPGARLYRSGDVGRFLPGGEVEFLGRVDHQVKVRGYRIELGEIEAALARHEGVRETVVIVREDGGGKRVVAYVVAGEGRTPAAGELRAYLSERLPEYMVPSAFVLLGALPLTSNGKVNRAALPAPEEAGAEAAGGDYVAPRTPVEEMLVGMWSEVLGVRRPGVHDDFFAAGGHSLLATQLMSRVREGFGVEVPLRGLFESPTIAELAQLVEGLLRGGDTRLEAPPIVPGNRESAPPLSFAQQRLWFIDQLEPESSVYNVALGVRLNGALDVAALERSIGSLIARHETLRTRFVAVEGEPRQIIDAPREFQLEVEDLSGIASADREREACDRAAAEANRAFDLSAGPLLRVRLMKLAADEHVAVMVLHHIISDGWSLGILIRELDAFYRAHQAGEPAELPELPVQYADFAIWQREWLQGDVLDAQLSYWKEQLDGAPPVMELPIDRPRSAQLVSRWASEEFLLDAELRDQLQTLARGEGVTLFMVLLAAFQLLLMRYSGQRDIVVGTDIANRNRHETEGLIGFFINQLVMRARIERGWSFRELLREAQRVSLGGYAHQDVPFEKVVEAVNPDREASRTPLFQHKLVLQNTPFGEVALGDVRMTPLVVEGETAKFELLWNLVEGARGLEGDVQYEAALYERETVRRMIGHFRQLLLSIMADAELPLAELEMFTPQERRQLLAGWNDTKAEYPAEKCLHHLFQEQVGRTPDALALVFEDQQLSYGELNARANKLARYLQSRGVGVESVVGIMLERSVEMVVALLGVLKAGAAYVPLDMQYPPQRLSYMLADSGAQMLVTGHSLPNGLPDYHGAVVSLEAEWPEIARESAANVEGGARAQNLAYIIYTSGSTGQPKGVMISHHAISNHMFWMLERFPLLVSDRVLQKTNFSFDASVWEFYAPLLAGACLVMAAPDAARSGGALVAELLRHDISIVQVVPSVLRLMLAEPDLAACRTLRRLYSGGEALGWEEMETAARVLGGAAEVCNLYGPTEATIDAGYWSYDGARAEELKARGASVPVGRPVANAEFYILDEAWQPVAVGVGGELYVGGAGLARGYLKRPALTAEKFIPHPFGRAGGERLYRTGDVARYLENGEVEYLGRADHQVKVRGFRIELGEIEAALREHERVREAVVIVRGEGTDQRLVAYVVAESEGAVSAAELRDWSGESLPQYMVPQSFVLLPEMPLTPNGKLDRKALPDVEQGDREGQYIAPRTAVEEVVAGIWSEVLGVERVGVEDNFFELGGHSLLATQVIFRVVKAFSVKVPVRSLFLASTVSMMAETVEQALGASAAAATTNAPTEATTDAATDALQIKAAPRNEPLPLSFAQQRLWFLDQLQPGSPLYNAPVALRFSGDLDVAVLERALSEVVRRHESLRTTFAEAGGQPVQIINPPAPLTLRVEDLNHLGEAEREAEVRRLSEEEAQQPFDLGAGPLLRARLLRLSDEQHVLLFTLHHINTDGWSMGVLVREVTRLYEAYLKGAESPLAELTIQYADFAVWQRQWMSGEVLERELNYWRQQLEGAPPVLELPTDRPHPAVRSFAGARHSFLLSEELTEGLRRLSREEGATLFMTLLAGWQALLARYSGQSDIVVGSPIAGRNRAETESLIGFFVNTFALRARVDGGRNFRELLRQVRDTALSAYAHQDIPFERLVEELAPERSMSHTPLFQVMFTMQNAAALGAEMAGLRLSLIEEEQLPAKFDLMLDMQEVGQGINATFVYNPELFDRATVERMTASLLLLLDGISSDAGRPISALPLIGEDERQHLLGLWDDTRAVYQSDACLHELFEAQARLRPDATALTTEQGDLSYGEMNRRANRLAHHLRALGVGADSLVALLMERSAETVVSLLAVLKAGGAYLPLDPQTPRERLAFTLDDARPVVVLTQPHLAEKLTDCCDAARVVSVDEDWGAFAELPAENPDARVTPDNLAYVIYTSGSTGQPKGVSVTHANVTRLMASTEAWFDFGAQDVWTLFHSYAFDFSVWELWGALAYGGRLVVVPYMVSRSPEAFYELLAAEKVTVLNQTPSAFRQLMRAEEARPDGALDLSLRTVIFGGEALEVSTLAPWFARHGDRRPQLVNMYGITETTVHVTYRALRQDDAARPAVGSVIGLPLPDLSAYVLDESLQVVPPGVAGELYVGGAGLARGYLNRPALTAERFIPHPFSPEPGARLYKTGDVVRYAAGDEIEYLGRADEQVKIRGFRIELGEVAAALTHHAAVREAVVVLREDKSGDKRLVAYFVPADADGADAEQPAGTRSTPLERELRLYLKERMPDYMVPAAFVSLERMPLTANGKLDRRALPDPARGELDTAFGGAHTPVEEMLLNLWRELLGVEQVGAHDSFFDLGGHSLLATQLASRVRETFGVTLELRELFAQPTAAELAQHVETRLRAGAGLDERAAVVRPQPRAGAALPLSFAQQRLWFADQLEPGGHSYNVPVALRLSGALDTDALTATLTELVRRHESLRTTFAEVDGQPVQIVNAPAPLAVGVEDLGGLEEAEREVRAQALAHEEAQRPFDLRAGAPLRIRLLRLAEQEHVLLLTLHHIITDGWSMGVLVREVAALYRAFAAGQASPLAELEVQYGDFAVWQREWMSGEVLEGELDYWRRQLGGGGDHHGGADALPLDRPRPAVQELRGASVSFVLGGELNRGVSRLSQRAGATRFMVLLAAFKAVLHYYGRRDEVVVGINVANRNRREVEGVIGFFVNTLALRTDISGNPSFHELLRRVRETALGAYAHQDLPFEKVAAAVSAGRGEAGQSPLFRVKVEYDEPAGMIELPGLRITPLYDVSGEIIRTDLRLSLAEGADELAGSLVYDRDLFDAATIERMVEHYLMLLRRVVAEPEVRLDELVKAMADDDAAHARRSLAGNKQANLQRLKERLRRPAPEVPVGGGSRV